MDYEEDLRDTLKGDLLDSYRECLVCVSVLAIVCSFVHLYTVNLSSAVADFILGLSTLYFVINPSVTFIISLMTYSVTLFCTLALLLLVELFRHPKIWLYHARKRLDITLVLIDLIASYAVFNTLNKVWKSPSYTAVEPMPSWYYNNIMLSKNNIWIPFTGTGNTLFDEKV